MCISEFALEADLAHLFDAVPSETERSSNIIAGTARMYFEGHYSTRLEVMALMLEAVRWHSTSETHRMPHEEGDCVYSAYEAALRATI